MALSVELFQVLLKCKISEHFCHILFIIEGDSKVSVHWGSDSKSPCMEKVVSLFTKRSVYGHPVRRMFAVSSSLDKDMSGR